MKEYNYYLFDADGTILDSSAMILECFKNTLKVFQAKPVDADVINSHVGLPFRVQIEKYLGPLSEEEFSRVFKTHNDYQLSIYKNYLKAFPNSLLTLSALKKKNKKLALVTSRTRPSAELYLKHLNLWEFFDTLICYGEADKNKPDPAPAFKAMDLLKAEAKESLFIGDAIYDSQCARGAGIDFAYVNWSHTPLTKFESRPDYCLDDLNELWNDNFKD